MCIPAVTSATGAEVAWSAELSARFSTHLSAQRGLSPHTVRAYTGDLEHLFAYARTQGRTTLK